MGGVASFASTALSTAGELLGSHSADSNYYKKMAQSADRQASLLEQNAQRQAEYLFKSASLENKRLYQQYAQTLGEQKTALAASGLGAGSATTQTILRNSRLNALMDEETQRYNVNAAIYENNTAASQQAWALRDEASQYRKMRKNRTSLWGNMSAYAARVFNVK